MKMRALAIGGALLATFMATSAGAASLDLSKDISAQGAKPAWTLKVSNGTKMNLTRPGKPALTATAPGAAISAEGASLSGKTANGQTLKASFQTKTCTLGSTKYPMTAQVEVGAETLSGCAGYAK
jgi:uncharacterized membrane protein